MKCKFCGCTDSNACQLRIVIREDEPGGCRLALPGEPADGLRPCSWFLFEICDAPACIERAYQEASGVVRSAFENEFSARLFS